MLCGTVHRGPLLHTIFGCDRGRVVSNGASRLENLVKITVVAVFCPVFTNKAEIWHGTRRHRGSLSDAKFDPDQVRGWFRSFSDLKIW